MRSRTSGKRARGASQVLYTRPIVGLCDAFSVSRSLSLEEVEDLTDEWLQQKLGLQ